MATGNVCRKFGELGTVIFETYKWTDIQTRGESLENVLRNTIYYICCW